MDTTPLFARTLQEKGWLGYFLDFVPCRLLYPVDPQWGVLLGEEPIVTSIDEILVACLGRSALSALARFRELGQQPTMKNQGDHPSWIHSSHPSRS